MAQQEKSFSPISRFSIVAFAALLMILGSACEGFYSDSLPTPQIALPTPANIQEGNPEDLVEAGARTALAAALDISPDSPRKILLEGATWTDSAPGCYPRPPGVSDPYLIPGYRLLMQYEGVFYEYDADLGGATGALCDSTLQLVPVEPALDIVVVNQAGSVQLDFDTVYILRSEDDVTEFNSNYADIATIAVGVIDWTVEVLIGGWAITSLNTEAVRAYRSPDKSTPGAGTGSTTSNIVIEVAVPDGVLPEQAVDVSIKPMQIWALVDITESGSTYQFVVPD